MPLRNGVSESVQVLPKEVALDVYLFFTIPDLATVLLAF